MFFYKSPQLLSSQKGHSAMLSVSNPGFPLERESVIYYRARPQESRSFIQQTLIAPDWALGADTGSRGQHCLWGSVGPGNELSSKANEGNERGAQESLRRNLGNASPRTRASGRTPPPPGARPPPRPRGALPQPSAGLAGSRAAAPGRRRARRAASRPRPPRGGRRRRPAGRARPRPRVPGSARTRRRAPPPRRTPAARSRPALEPRSSALALGPGPAACRAGPHSPSLAFFLRASVPPSFPKKESSFFRDGGDLGVGDLGTEGDFCGDVAMAAERAAARGPAGTRSWRWAGAAGLRLRLSKRKRNYSKHLRQLTLAFPFPLSLPRAALRPGRSCALGARAARACARAPWLPGAGRVPQMCPLAGRAALSVCACETLQPGGHVFPGLHTQHGSWYKSGVQALLKQSDLLLLSPSVFARAIG